MRTLIVGGLGIRDLEQMTLETQSVCLKADKVLYLGVTPERHIEQMKSWGLSNIESILELYVDGDIDTNNYGRIYDAILEAASDNQVTVLLVPGHPRIGVTVVQWLERDRQTNPFKLEVLAGVSSFDTLLNDIARDPIEKGSLLVDANRMLLFKTKWDATFDCYLYHVCSVGTSKVHVSDAKKDNAWARLKTHLLEIYPPEAKVELVSSPTTRETSGLRIASTLAEIESLFDHVHFGTTLFIAGQKPKKVDGQFLDLLMKGRVQNETQSATA